MATNTRKVVSTLRRKALVALLASDSAGLWTEPSNIALAFGMSREGARYVIESVRGEPHQQTIRRERRNAKDKKS